GDSLSIERDRARNVATLPQRARKRFAKDVVARIVADELLERCRGLACAAGVEQRRRFFEGAEKRRDGFRIAFRAAGRRGRRDVAEAGQLRARFGVDGGCRGCDSGGAELFETRGEVVVRAALIGQYVYGFARI